MRTNDLLSIVLMDECLGRWPAFLRQKSGTPAYQQTYHSGILCVKQFWHRFGKRLQFGAHQGSAGF